MCATELLSRLLEIERAIGVEEPLRIREMLMQAQECVLELQKNAIYRLEEERMGPAMMPFLAARNYQVIKHTLQAGDLPPAFHQREPVTAEAGHSA